MDGVFWLCEAQLESIKPFFPQSPGLSRVDGSKVVSGSIYVHVTACALVDAPAPYGPHKTLSNRCRPWWEMGVSQVLFSELV